MRSMNTNGIFNKTLATVQGSLVSPGRFIEGSDIGQKPDQYVMGKEEFLRFIPQ